ncbi:hypothetical protein [Schlesneria paludicola]|uniref:hypothetical protein n=1 Tax=Schlesneria paludicola TaxID=360056 RepID=UPI00029B1F6E|nr:hypothetical protein [Schlesneria paludicola]
MTEESNDKIENWVLHEPNSNPNTFRDPIGNPTTKPEEAQTYPSEELAKRDNSKTGRYAPRRLKEFWPPKE